MKKLIMAVLLVSGLNADCLSDMNVIMEMQKIVCVNVTYAT